MQLLLSTPRMIGFNWRTALKGVALAAFSFLFTVRAAEPLFQCEKVIITDPQVEAIPLLDFAANAQLMSVISSDQTLSLPLPGCKSTTIPAFVTRPLSFERNDGQTASEVNFLARGQKYCLFLTKDEAVLKLFEFSNGAPASADRTPRRRSWKPAHSSDDALSPLVLKAGLGTTHSCMPRVLRMRLVGANPQVIISQEEPLSAKANYFIGNDLSSWHTNIPSFGKIRYRDVYPGIDLVFYGDDRQLEYDFVLTPNANPNQIAMEWQGADDMWVDPGGDLVMKAGGFEVRWPKPLVYQEYKGGRYEIAAAYRLGDRNPGVPHNPAKIHGCHLVSFTLAGYDPSVPLVIDPRLVCSTYLGGMSYDYARDLAVDAQGNVYVAGITASLDFPTKAAFQGSASGGEDSVFVSKFNSVGELLFSTYLGGSGDETALNAGSREVVMAVTPSGDCYVAGATDSTNFPLMKPLQSSLRGKSDAFVTALKSDGSALLFSTYLGGNQWDGANGIAIGPGEDVFVVGGTESSNFPTTNAFQPRISIATGNNGYQEPDAFITRLEAGGRSIRYSTFYGVSTRFERAWDVAVDAEGSAYVAMVGHIADFWTGGYTDGEQWLIARMSADGKTRLFERRWPDTIPPLPSSQHPWTIRLALAPAGRVVIAGQINLDGVPLPAVNDPDPTIVGWNEVYVAQFDATNGDFVSAAYLGGNGQDNVAKVLVDGAGDIIVVGDTAGQNGEPSGFPVTDPLESGPEPGQSLDLFVAKLRSADLSLIESALVGGPDTESIFQGGGAGLDPQGNLWLAGRTYGHFPTANAFQSQYHGGGDAFLAKLSFGQELRITLAGQAVTICLPVQATNYILEATTSLPAISWTTVTNTPTVTATNRSVQLPLTGPAQFFRLRQP